MARRTNNIEVAVVGEADFGRARRDAARDLARIENEAEGTADDIKRAFDRIDLSPELDTADIRQALDLAGQLDGMVARLDINADLDEIQQAEKIARSLRAFQGRVDLSVEGRAELQDALGLADKLDQIRTVKVQVQGQRDLQRASDLADDLGKDLAQAGEVGAEGIADAIGGIDFQNLGAMGLDQLTGALSAAGPWGAAAAAIGVVFGDELVDGLQQGFNRRRNDVIRAVTSGASEADLAAAGRAAGEAWNSGFGDSIPQLQADADEINSILGDMVSDADLTPLLKQSQILADILGVEVTQAAELARRSVKQGLADDVQDAFDDMIGVTQEFGAAGVEALDVLEEFGPNFSRFEIDGGRAVQFVAGSFRDGLIPTIDRAGEAFEEFTTRIIDSDSADEIAELGLNFQEIQRAVAEGGPPARDAMREVVQALINVSDESDRARIANVIFGQSFEQVSDQGELLSRIMQLLSDDTDAYAGTAQELVGELEGVQSAFQQMQRDATEAGVFLGESLQSGIDLAFGLNDSFEGLIPTVLRWAGATEEASGEAKRFTKSAEDASRSTGSFGDEAGLAADDVAELGGEVGDLRSELEKLFGFQPDQLMRQIHDEAADLADAFGEVDASAVGMNGEINISTEAGRRLQSQLENMSEALIDVEVAYGNGEISAGEYRAASALLRGEFNRVTGSAGLTTSQVEALRQKYLQLPDNVTTNVRANVDSFGINEMARFKRIIDSIPRNVTTNVTTRRRTRFVRARAAGGPTTGLTLVGEEGPELLDLGSQRGFVHNNDDTRRMIASAASSFSGGGGGGGMARQAPVVLEIRSGGSAFDDALVEVLRKSIQNRGGNVQQVLG